MNEICEEIFIAKHSPASSTCPLQLSSRLLLEALPFHEDDVAIAAYIRNKILTEQQQLTCYIKEDKSLQDLIHVDAIDTFKQETTSAIVEACESMAEAILARCLIEAVADLGNLFNLQQLLDISH